MRTDRVCVQGDGQWNEDALVMREDTGLFGVLDGATSFVPFRGPGGETGGLLAVRTVRQYLESLDVPDWTDLTPERAALQANERLGAAMRAAGIDETDPGKLWSAAFALVRVTEKRVYYAQAGDCMIVAFYGSDEVRVLTHDQIDPLDRETRRRWQACGTAPMGERLAAVAPHIVANKVRMNAPDGYGSMNGQPALADYMESGALSRTGLSALLLFTDGLFPLADAYDRMTDFAAAAAEMRTLGLQAYTNRLLALEQGDADCIRYPRIKRSDDKTALLIELSQ